MKTELWQIGQTSFDYLKKGCDIYEKRLTHYIPFQAHTFNDLKNTKKLSEEQIKVKEGELVLKKIEKGDFLVLFDERGKTFSSLKFADYFEQQMHMGHRRMIFLIGGAYGFSPAVYARANAKISLSTMTFSHQMVRLFSLEQIYRAMTILRNQPYHHE